MVIVANGARGGDVDLLPGDQSSDIPHQPHPIPGLHPDVSGVEGIGLSPVHRNQPLFLILVQDIIAILAVYGYPTAASDEPDDGIAGHRMAATRQLRKTPR